MLERLRTAITADPWRTATVAVGLALIGAIIGLFVVSGGDAQPATAQATTTTTPAVTTTAAPAPTTSVPGGEPGSPVSAFDGVVAIKIDNSRPARPQWGLADASLLVEYFVEGPISRFTAVIPTGLTGVMGPVRSLRPVDADLLPVLAGAVVSTGGRPFVVQDVEATGIQNIVAELSSMFPSEGNVDPYDTFVDLEILDAALTAAPAPPVGIPAGTLPDPSARASELVLPFEGSVMRYDSNLGYVHERAGEPFMVFDTTGSNPTPLAHDTAVVMFAAERYAGYSDVNGVPVMTYDVIGGGDLLVLHEGGVVTGEWRRNSLQDGFEFFDSSGNSFGLPQGRIYMAIVPRDSQVSYR